LAITLDQTRSEPFEKAISAMAEFRRAFGRDLKPDFIAELYASRELGLTLREKPNEQGFDAIDRDGKRYEIKHRRAQNVDLNNFGFDFLVLVNLDDDFRVAGMWRMTVDKAKEIFQWRDRFNKYQATQAKAKANSVKVR